MLPIPFPLFPIGNSYTGKEEILIWGCLIDISLWVNYERIIFIRKHKQKGMKRIFFSVLMIGNS